MYSLVNLLAKKLVKKSGISYALTALALSALLLPAGAQVGRKYPPPVKPTVVGLTMPSDRDPFSLTITNDGQLYTTTVVRSQQTPITGATLLTNGPDAGGGLEIHGAIPNPDQFGSDIPILRLEIFTTEMDTLSPFSDVGTNPLTGRHFSFTSWTVERITGGLPGGHGYHQGFRFEKSPGGADINTGDYYALLHAALADPNDPGDFASTNFGIRGFTTEVPPVPEPGSIAMLAGLGITGISVFLRRRK